MFLYRPEHTPSSRLDLETAESVIATARSTWVTQMFLVAAIIGASTWIANGSSGPAVIPFQILSAFGAIWLVALLYAFLKGFFAAARNVRAELSKKIDQGADPQRFWMDHRNLFPPALY
jgi:hypothetical protein